MKLRSVVAAVAVVLSASSWVGSGAHGQGLPAPVPPAYSVAQRLDATAHALAASQPDIARRRAVQAIKKYLEVTNSGTFRHGAYAAESYYHEALLQRDFIKDEFGVGDLGNAVQSLKTLKNNFDKVSYPDKTNVQPTLDATQKALDRDAQTFHPTPWGTIGPVLYKVMDFFVHLCGGSRFSYSYFLAILLISLLVRLALTPISNAQYASMKRMQKLQPVIKEIQAKYKDDKEKQGQKVMQVYKDHGVNPAAGCIPALAQAPVFILLYQMIVRYQYQFNNGDFLWIGSGLSHTFPSFLGTSLGQPDIPVLLLYAFSMYVQQKMMVSPDPQQAEQQRTMALLTPFMTTYFFLQYHLPSAFVLYYLVSNILSTAQQAYYMKKRATDVGGGDGGSKILLDGDLPLTPGGGGSFKTRPNGSNGSGNGTSRRVSTGRDVPLAEAKDGSSATSRTGDKFSRPSSTNGATPAARGVIAPTKIHPKKKRR
jgi:YidC/Oxa1 family membrane protein insertase